LILTLKITAASGQKPGETTRQAFTEEGGTIGRAATNTWVLSHNKVSGRHAVITYRSGVFYLQDTSRNGVAINSPHNRLVRDRPYALNTGDRILIEPYEIAVSVDEASAGSRPFADVFGQDDPFAPSGGPMPDQRDLVPPHGMGSGEVDPLKFFDPLVKSSPARRGDPIAAPADDWLGQHYDPPVPVADVAPVQAEPAPIPQGYNPLAPDDSIAPPIAPRRPKPAGEPAVHRQKPKPAPPRDPAPAEPVAPVQFDPPPVEVPAPAPVAVAQPVPVAPASDAAVSRGFADVLIGAGLPGAAVTPELAKSLGEILRVVVSGLMDILQARQHIKEEFRMSHTIVRQRDNNPLKFSANVDDALHNLLVKRNPAYLGAVDAFADAFDDLRDHQLAMLAGMRVAFEAMLAEFHPDRLQEEFDRQAAKGASSLVPAKMRYWDLFQEKRKKLEKDPEATFADLFGEEFARAYEEQFRALKARRGSGGG
jgi:type VI secretion system FHA domain protein